VYFDKRKGKKKTNSKNKNKSKSRKKNSFITPRWVNDKTENAEKQQHQDQMKIMYNQPLKDHQKCEF